jgi:hypothetical protein
MASYATKHKLQVGRIIEPEMKCKSNMTGVYEVQKAKMEILKEKNKGKERRQVQGNRRRSQTEEK